MPPIVVVVVAAATAPVVETLVVTTLVDYDDHRATPRHLFDSDVEPFRAFEPVSSLT